MLREILAALGGHPGDLVIVPNESAAAVWTLHDSCVLSTEERRRAEALLPLGTHCRAMRRFLKGFNSAAEWCGLTDPTGEEPSTGVAQAISRSVYSHAVISSLRASLGEYVRCLSDLAAEIDSGLLSLPRIAAACSPWMAVWPSLTDLCSSLALCGSTGRMMQVIRDAECKATSEARRHIGRVCSSCVAVLLRLTVHWTILGEAPPGKSGFYVQMPEDASTGEADASMEWLDRRSLPPQLTEQSARLALTAGMHTRMLSAAKATKDCSLLPDSQDIRDCLCGDEVLAKGQYAGGGLHVPALEERLKVVQEVRALRLAAQVCGPQGELPHYLKMIGAYCLCFRGDLWRTFSQRSTAISSELINEVLSDDIGVARRRTPEQTALLARRSQRKRLAAFALSRDLHPHGDPPHLAGSLKMIVGVIGAEESGVGLGDELCHAVERLRKSGWDQAARLTEFGRLFSDVTSSMSLHLTVEWPLTDVLTADCMMRLKSVFKSCMHLVHTETVLTEAHRHLSFAEKVAHRQSRKKLGAMEERDARVRLGRKMLRSLLTIRRRMAFLFDNLKYFVMTDVLHADFLRLQKEVVDGRGYDEIKARCHGGLQRMVEDAFLDQGTGKENRLVTAAIAKAIRCALELWTLVASSLSALEGAEGFPVAMVRLSKYHQVAWKIADRFDSHATTLYQILRSNPHMRKYSALLVRLDFNNYYSRELERQSLEKQRRRNAAVAAAQGGAEPEAVVSRW